MIENYEKYLEFISGKIDGFFEKQKPYIACKEGCSPEQRRTSQDGTCAQSLLVAEGAYHGQSFHRA